MCELCRRSFIGGIAAVGTVGAIPTPLLAQAQMGSTGQASSSGLPARGEFVIRNGFVLTMDSALGDIPRGSVHVRNGEIVAVGADVNAPAAEVIDATDMIVLPGLIETHWHMWNTLFRSFAGDEQAHGYFPTVARYGAVMTPDDMYQGARLSAAEAIYSGMTTVHDWCHNIRSREYAERDIQALKDTGIRARFSYGWSQGQDDKDILNLRDIEALHRDWKSHSNDGLITLGLGWRGKFRAGPLPENVYRTELDAARTMGIPITVHFQSRKNPPNQIEAHAKELLGKDVQLMHAVWATPDELKMGRRRAQRLALQLPRTCASGLDCLRSASFWPRAFHAVSQLILRR